MRHRKVDQKRAEDIACAFLAEWCGCADVIRSIRARFARQDLWGADALGFAYDTLCAVQVTTGLASSLSHRRRKLEAVNWIEACEVMLMQVRRVGGRLVEYEWRYQMFDPGERRWGEWSEWESVPRSWWER